MVDASHSSNFLSLFIFAGSFAVILIVLFSLLHRTEFFKYLHASRMYVEDEGAPKKPMDSAFGWLKPVWAATEQNIIESCGLDAAIYIRMFTFSIQLFVLIALVCLPVLLPVNATGGNINQLPASTGALDNLSASNVGHGAQRLWAHFACLYVISGITIACLWRTYAHVWRLRHAFLAQRARARSPEEYTLLVTDIPKPDLAQLGKTKSVISFFDKRGSKGVSVEKKTLRGFFKLLRVASMGLVQAPYKVEPTGIARAQARLVDKYFSRLYPHLYLTHQSVRRFRKVQKAYVRWKHAATQLDRARFRLAAWREQNALREDPLPESAATERMRLGLCGCWGRQVDVIPHWEEQVLARSVKLKEEQKMSVDCRVTSAAFVTFNSRRVAAVASQALHSAKGGSWRLQMAPQPGDVVWPNVELSLSERVARTTIFSVLFGALILLFYVPVTFIAGLTTLKNLVKLLPFLKSTVKDKWFHGFLSSLLPGLALRIILWCVPPLLMLMARLQGEPSRSAIQRNATQRFYYVLLFNVFLGSTFTDTLLSQLQAILDHPKELVHILAVSIPQASSFFITYVVVSSVLFGLELLRMPIPLARYLYLRWWVGAANAQREKLWSPGGIAYHIFMPYQNLVVTFGLVFAVIAPLILPFVILYSCIGYIFVDHVFVALLIAQLTSVGLFGLKEAYYQAGWTIPLVVLTAYVMIMIDIQFKSTFGTLPLEMATDVDEYAESIGFEPEAEHFAREYVPACLKEFRNPRLSTDPNPDPDTDKKHNSNNNVGINGDGAGDNDGAVADDGRCKDGNSKGHDDDADGECDHGSGSSRGGGKRSGPDRRVGSNNGAGKPVVSTNGTKRGHNIGSGGGGNGDVAVLNAVVLDGRGGERARAAANLFPRSASSAGSQGQGLASGWEPLAALRRRESAAQRHLAQEGDGEEEPRSRQEARVQALAHSDGESSLATGEERARRRAAQGSPFVAGSADQPLQPLQGPLPAQHRLDKRAGRDAESTEWAKSAGSAVAATASFVERRASETAAPLAGTHFDILPHLQSPSPGSRSGARSGPSSGPWSGPRHASAASPDGSLVWHTSQSQDPSERGHVQDPVQDPNLRGQARDHSQGRGQVTEADTVEAEVEDTAGTPTGPSEESPRRTSSWPLEVWTGPGPHYAALSTDAPAGSTGGEAGQDLQLAHDSNSGAHNLWLVSGETSPSSQPLLVTSNRPVAGGDADGGDV
eukprot:jgi/Mesen1/5161/ME000256S04348